MLWILKILVKAQFWYIKLTKVLPNNYKKIPSFLVIILPSLPFWVILPISIEMKWEE